jgi:hypothetical protein
MADNVEITVDASGNVNAVFEDIQQGARDTASGVQTSMGTTEAAFDTAARGAGRFSAAMDSTAGGVGTAADAVDGFGQVAQGANDIMNYGEKKAEDLARAQNDVAQAAQDAKQAVEDMAQAERDASQADQDLEQANLDLDVAISDRAEKQKELNKAIKDHGPNSKEAKDAMFELRQANLDITQAEEDKAQAIRDSEQATLDGEQAMIDQKTAADDLTASQRELETQSSVLTKITEWAGMLGGVLGGLVGIIGAVAAIQWVWNAAMSANPIGLVVLAIAALVGIIVVIATKTDWFQRLWHGIWNGIIVPVRKAWDWLYANAGKLFSWLGKKVTDVITVTRNQFNKVKDIIYAPFKAAFGMVSRAWNSTVGGFGFSVPSWVPGVGGNSFTIPNMPSLAVGGDVLKSGMAFIHAGERIIPRSQTQRLGYEPRTKQEAPTPLGADIRLTLDSALTDSKFMNLIHDNIRVYVKSRGRGNVQVAYGVNS